MAKRAGPRVPSQLPAQSRAVQKLAILARKPQPRRDTEPARQTTPGPRGGVETRREDLEAMHEPEPPGTPGEHRPSDADPQSSHRPDQPGRERDGAAPERNRRSAEEGQAIPRNVDPAQDEDRASPANGPATAPEAEPTSDRDGDGLGLARGLLVALALSAVFYGLVLVVLHLIR